MANLTASKIALRYLFSKKTTGAVGVISTVALCGVAVATVAIVCVLSVFNGFHDVLAGKIDALSPDIIVKSAKGKVIENADSLASLLSLHSEVVVAMPMVSDNAYATAGSRQTPIMLMGVDADKFARLTSIKKIIEPDGRYKISWLDDDNISEEDETLVVNEPMQEDIASSDLFAEASDLYADADSCVCLPDMLLSVGVAMRLERYPGDELELYTPVRHGRVNMGNPAASFVTESILVSGVFHAEQSDYDSDLIIADLQFVRKMFQYTTQASEIWLKVAPTANAVNVANCLREEYGDEFIVKDRLQQKELNFRMINIEKWITFVMLTFIMLIASFNIISSMAMLIVDKRQSIETLRNLGARKRMIIAIFRYETIYVNLLGGIVGILFGTLLCLLQQHFGLIGIGDESSQLIIDSYPVMVELSDLAVVLLAIVVVGLLSAEVVAQFVKQKLKD